MGLEPIRTHCPTDFKSVVSTNSTIKPYTVLLSQAILYLSVIMDNLTNVEEAERYTVLSVKSEEYIAKRIQSYIWGIQALSLFLPLPA